MNSRINYGFECEYFLGDSTGEILYSVPSRFPRDAAGHLIESRSKWYADPLATLSSLLEEDIRLEELAASQGLNVVRLPRYKYSGRTSSQGRPEETAGFHIHFSCDGKQMDLPQMITLLNKRFAGEISSAGRDGSYPEHYRMKPHGWEYRRLPATINPREVAKYLRTWGL